VSWTAWDDGYRWLWVSVTNLNRTTATDVSMQVVCHNVDGVYAFSGPTFPADLASGATTTLSQIRSDDDPPCPDTPVITIDATSAPTDPLVPPSAPRSVVAGPRNRAAVVSWAHPVNTGGTPVTEYVVTASPGGRTCGTAGARACTVTGLTNGKAYRFSVRARNAAGTGATSVLSNAVVAGVPTTPRSLAVTFPARGTATVSWRPPAYINAGPVLRYLVRWSSNSGATWTLWRSVGDRRSATRAGLRRGHTYLFAARAVNMAGRGLVATKSFTR
jgi:hypothetical protein